MIRRLRTFILITGTTLCVLIAAVFVVSGWWQVAFQVPTPRGPALYLVAGSVLIVNDQMLSAPVSAGSQPFNLSRWNGWVFQRLGSKLARGPTIIVTYIEFPLYALFAAVAVPTLLAWRFWPMAVRPGHCPCGYDLRGNESGTCPECGREAG